MNKTKPDQKHLTLSDRVYIEQELAQGTTFRSIAATLCKDPSTISKEVRKHSREIPPYYFRHDCTKCAHFNDCDIHGNDIGINCYKNQCRDLCRHCRKTDPTAHCSYFRPFSCRQTSQPPYVCNACNT